MGHSIKEIRGALELCRLFRASYTYQINLGLSLSVVNKSDVTECYLVRYSVPVRLTELRQTESLSLVPFDRIEIFKLIFFQIGRRQTRRQRSRLRANPTFSGCETTKGETRVSWKEAPQSPQVGFLVFLISLLELIIQSNLYTTATPGA